MSDQRVHIVSGAPSTIGIAVMLYAIAMTLMTDCGPTKRIRLENPSPVICECRCAP